MIDLLERHTREPAKVKMSMGMLKEWMQKLDKMVALELAQLAQKNTDLHFSNDVINLRLEPLQAMDKQLLAQGELDINGVLKAKGDVVFLKTTINFQYAR